LEIVYTELRPVSATKKKHGADSPPKHGATPPRLRKVSPATVIAGVDEKKVTFKLPRASRGTSARRMRTTSGRRMAGGWGRAWRGDVCRAS
jgi:hypothetical protein